MGDYRASQLQCELEEQVDKVHKVQAALDKAGHMLSEKDTDSAISKAATEAASREISSLRGELKAHADAAAKVDQLWLWDCYMSYTCKACSKQFFVWLTFCCKVQGMITGGLLSDTCTRKPDNHFSVVNSLRP